MNQVGGILKSVEVNKNAATKALRVLIDSSTKDGNTKAVKIYADAWQHVTGEACPNSNSATCANR